MSANGEITAILDRVNEGDQQAVGELFTLVYNALRSQAGEYMSRERRDHTLQPTALVNEAFLKVVASRHSWESSRHFYNAVAQAMRTILVDHARTKRAAKRGGADHKRVEMTDVAAPMADDDSVDLEALDRALDRLQKEDERRHQVVMYRYFAGLSEERIAELLNVSEKTVRRDWQTAKLFLLAEMSGPDGN
jgi:RNA polymerase sigma factor (TIGR02999 family)